MTRTPENKEQTAQNENTLIIKIIETSDQKIKLEVDANTSTKVVHASVINLLPNAIKQFAEGIAGDDKDFYNQMLGQATKELIGASHVAQVDVKISEMKPVVEILTFAMKVANKFIENVDTGKARSVETYKDMKDLVSMIQTLQDKIETPEDPKPIQEWKPYTGDYEKQFYDVKDKDGNILTKCWPNAWFLNVPDSDIKFAVEDNVMIRPSVDQ